MKICSRCTKLSKVIKRTYCNSCYEFLRRNKIINIVKIPTPQTITYEQEQHLIGSMLGDGCIEFGKNAANARLHLLRKETDLAYLKWQREIFENLCTNHPISHVSYLDKRTNNTYFKCYFRTRNCEILNLYHKKWYPEGKKIVPKDLILTPLILLIWFLDDGSMSIIKNNRLSITLSTNGFKKLDTQYLADQLSNMTGYYFGVHKSGNSYFIQGSDGPARAFANIIDSIFPDCMLRKAKWREPKVRFNDPSLKISKSQGKRNIK